MNLPVSPPVLQVQDLSFSYPGRPVFTGWSASFKPGLTWVRGSNGSGESTLLKLLAGALPPLARSARWGWLLPSRPTRHHDAGAGRPCAACTRLTLRAGRHSAAGRAPAHLPHWQRGASIGPSPNTPETSMAKPLFDADALIAQFESATAKQGEQLRKATTEATMSALQGRELTLKNIKDALKTVAEAASTGVAKNALAGAAGLGGMNPEALLDQAVHGMDDALLKAVDANRTALNTLMAQGADLRDKHLSKALGDLEKMEDAMFSAVKTAAAGAGAPMAGAWGPVLEKMQLGGTLSGAKAASTAEEMTEQMQSAIRNTRAASVRAAQALAESYTAMVSGVLVGMQQALQTKPGKGKK